jgi:hypothetical protein
MGRRILLGTCLSVLMLAAHPESILSSWYAHSPAAAMYESARPALADLVAEAESKGIPAELVMQRVAEGAGKRVPPQKLLEALRKDIDNYAYVLSALEAIAPGSTHGAGGRELLERGGMVLRSGMEAASFGQALRYATARGKDVTRAVSALVAVAALASRLPLEASDRVDLAVSLCLSVEREDRFSMLTPLFLRGRAGKLAPHDLVLLAKATFEAGGGLLQLENEINRRLK